MSRTLLLRRLLVVSLVVIGAVVFKPWPTTLLPTLMSRAQETPDDAVSLSRSLDGTSLELRLDCLKSATIDPEPSLSGRIEVAATADSQNVLDGLGLTGGTVARLEYSGRCTGHFFSDPSLALTIKVPPATPIDLRETGSSDYRIGAVGGPLKLDLSGSGDIEVAQASDLNLRISGSSDVKIGRLDGTGSVYVAGSGDVAIDHAAMPSLAVELRGSGDVSIDDARIDALTASTAGSGDISVDGTVKDATLSATGSGDIKLEKATGQVQQHTAGSAEIHIGRRTQRKIQRRSRGVTLIST